MEVVVAIMKGHADKLNFSVKCGYFLTHQFKHVFWVLKGTVSLRRFFWVPTTYVLVEKYENNFQIRTLIWRWL